MDITASTWLPQPVQVVFPQRAQRAGLHMWCSFGLVLWAHYTPMGINLARL